MKYTQRFNLLQVELKTTSFITANQLYFKDLNQIHHEKLKLTEGESYVLIWTDFFIKSCNEAFPKTDLVKKINALSNIGEPLHNVKAICKILDGELKRKPSNYKEQLVFNTSHLDMSLRLKKGFLSKLKSKFKYL